MVGLERAVESVEVFVWPLSNALEAIAVIELILLVGKSSSKTLLTCQDSSNDVTM